MGTFTATRGRVCLGALSDPGGAPRLGRPTVSAVADVPAAAAVGLLGVALEFCAELWLCGWRSHDFRS